MKKFVLAFSLTTAFYTALQAQQRVGINVTAPAENLHVDSTIKVGKNNTLGTNGRKNLIKFGDGDYVTIGEEQFDDKLYIRYGDLIFFPSAGNSNGRIGIKTEIPTADLDVNGSLRLRVSGATTGAVLTSDASGNATWQLPAITSIGFRGKLASDLDITSASGEATITGFTEDFDDGSGFNGAAGTFTAPSAGVYQFTVNLNWSQDAINTGSSLILTRLYLNRAGVNNIIEQVTTSIPNNTSYSQSQNFTSIYKLNVGDIISVRVDPQVSTTFTLGGNGSTACRFSGAKLY